MSRSDQNRTFRAIGRALDDILRERFRQIAKGNDAANDDAMVSGQLIYGALAFCFAAAGDYAAADLEWSGPGKRPLFHTKTPRECLVRAAAMAVAEIERIDRAELRTRTSGTTALRDAEHHRPDAPNAPPRAPSQSVTGAELPSIQPVILTKDMTL